MDTISDSKDHGANMGPTWVLLAPGGPHVGPINLAIRDIDPPPARPPDILREHTQPRKAADKVCTSNTSMPQHNGCCLGSDILKCIFWAENIRILF